MTAHARLSPSARVRWQNCPGSVRALSAYPPSKRKSGPSAVDGTHSHTLLEQCIIHSHDNTIDDPQKYLGMCLTDHEGSFSVNQERIDRVRVATDYIRSKIIPNVTKVHAERKVSPRALFNREDLDGTVDVTIVNGEHREIIDYKDGMQYVDVIDNLQLEQYVYGDYADVIIRGEEVTSYTTTIIQPKLALSGGNPISSITHSTGHFIERMPVLAMAAAATDAPDAPFVPGEKQCQYCEHRGACHPAATDALTKAGINFKDMTVTKDAAEKDVHVMTNEQLLELVLAGPLLRKMVESAEAEALDRITSGKPVPGLKVVRGSGRNSWSKSEEEIAAALKKMGVPKAAIFKTEIVSAPQALKLKWAKADGTAKQLTPRQLKVLTTEFIAKSEGKETVVPESDSRDAVAYTDITKLFAPQPPAEAVPLPSWLS
jgi:hypothetical protein